MKIVSVQFTTAVQIGSASTPEFTLVPGRSYDSSPIELDYTPDRGLKIMFVNTGMMQLVPNSVIARVLIKNEQ